MNIFRVSITILILAAFACNRPAVETDQHPVHAEARTSIEKLAWLIGTWKIVTPEGQLYEVWVKNSDSLYTATTAMIINNDTGFTEEISLVLKGDGLFYIPVIKGQNAGKPVAFRLVEESQGQFIFENKQHDFPQRIIYKNTWPDSLYACIEGNHGGEYRKEEFVMGRDKQSD